MSAPARPTKRAVLASLCALAFACALVSAGCAARPQDPLAASQPAEQVARTMFAAGVYPVGVGESGGTAVLRFSLPAADSAADVLIGTAAARSALTRAYPDARRRVVQVLSPAGAPLAEIVMGRDGTVEPRLVLDATEFSASFDAEEAAGGPRYLRAKNRAAGIDIEAATKAAKELRAAAPGRPAVPAGEDAGVANARLLAAALAGSGVVGADRLAAAASGVTPGSTPDEVLLWRHRLATAEALTRGIDGAAAFARLTDAVAEQVATAPIPTSGGMADTILATAGSDKAPASAKDATTFDQTRASGLSPSTPEVTTALQAGRLDTDIAKYGLDSDPERWPPVISPDSRLYYLGAPANRVAITDSSRDGFGWQLRRVALVDAHDIGTTLADVALP